MHIRFGRFEVETFGLRAIYTRIPGIGAVWLSDSEFVFDRWSDDKR